MNIFSFLQFLQKKRRPSIIRSQKGFTLIELLVVISIVGLLASVFLTNLSSARAKAQTAKRIAEIRSITDAIESYNIDHNEYPPAATPLFGIVIPGEELTDYVTPYLAGDRDEVIAALQDYRYIRNSANSYGLLLIGSNDDPCLAGNLNAFGSGAQGVPGC